MVIPFRDILFFATATGLSSAQRYRWAMSTFVVPMSSPAMYFSARIGPVTLANSLMTSALAGWRGSRAMPAFAPPMGMRIAANLWVIMWASLSISSSVSPSRIRSPPAESPLTSESMIT